MDLTNILTRISQVSILIPLLAGILNYFKLNKPFKKLVWFFVFCAFNEVFATLLVQLFGNNMALLHVFSVIEFCMFAYIFAQYFSVANKWFFAIIVAYFVIAFIDAFYINSLLEMNSIARNVECILLIIASLYFYYSNLNSNQIHSIYKQPMYWFSTAVIIYFSLNFFFFLSMNYLSYDMGRLGQNAHSIINTVSNIIFAFAFVSFKWKK